MTTTISLQEATKTDLDEIREVESHTSQDSVIKSLLLYRELYLQTRPNSTQPGAATRLPSTPGATPTPTRHTEPGHTAYIGKIGSGKTYTSKYHIHHTVSETSTDVMILDPIDSYTEFTTVHGGVTIPAADVLPTQPVLPGTDTPPETHTDWVTSILTETESGFNTDEIKTTIARMIEAMGEVRDADRPMRGEPLATVHFSTSPWKDDVENLLLGSVLAAFGEAAARDTTVDIYVDNAHYLLASAHGPSLLAALFDVGEDYDVNVNLITQTVEELMVTGTELLDAFTTLVLHRLPVDDAVCDELGLSDADAEYLRNAAAGTSETGYSEILIGDGDVWSQDRVQVSPDLHKLLEPRDFQQQ